MFTVHTVAEGCELVSGPDTAKGRVEVCGPRYHFRSPCRCLRSGLLPEAVLISMGTEELVLLLVGAGPTSLQRGDAGGGMGEGEQASPYCGHRRWGRKIHPPLEDWPLGI